MKVTKVLSVVVMLAASLQGAAQIPSEVESFPISSVRLTDSPFKHAEELDIQYLLGINPDRLLAPYLKEAGLQPKADWMATSEDIMFLPYRICMLRRVIRKSSVGWTT